MRKVSTRLPVIAGMIGLLGMTACSTGMEASRPVPVDLSQFHPGVSRFNVVSVVGAPKGSIDDTAGPCDIYSLYTTGLGGFGKGVVTGSEVITDVATLGLAEIIWTPVQASTRPRQHTVMFCYDHNEHLLSLLSRDPAANNAGKFRQTPEMVVPANSTTNAPATPTQATTAANHAPVTQPAATVSPQQASGGTVGDLSKELPADANAQAGAPPVKSSATTPGA